MASSHHSSASPEPQAKGSSDALPLLPLSLLVELDAVQAAWLDAIADLHACSRENVLREGLRRLIAVENARVTRTRRYDAIRLAARADKWDPISDYLGGLEVIPP